MSNFEFSFFRVFFGPSWRCFPNFRIQLLFLSSRWLCPFWKQCTPRACPRWGVREKKSKKKVLNHCTLIYIMYYYLGIYFIIYIWRRRARRPGWPLLEKGMVNRAGTIAALTTNGCITDLYFSVLCSIPALCPVPDRHLKGPPKIHKEGVL